jgi:hypothetical protein
MPVTGAQIVADARRYIGHGYVFGGPSNVKGGWDCSSYVSWVLGHDLRLALPGGSWAKVTGSGSQHGPDVADYLNWGGATTIPADQAQAGDLCCYGPNEHIAICTSRTGGISAEDPANGTQTAPLSSGPGPYVIRRINAATLAGGSAPASVTVPGALASLGHTAVGVIASLVSAAAVMAGAVVVGGLVLLGTVWLARHYAQKARSG